MQRDPFLAAADPTRRRILEMLREEERSAGEIASAFRVSWPAVSRHLRVLRQSGLIKERRAGRERLYTLDRARIHSALGSWVAKFDGMWAENPESLRTMLEKFPAGPAHEELSQGDGWREPEDQGEP